MKDEFSLYDIGRAALVLLLFIICAAIISVGILILISPVHADTFTINATRDGLMANNPADANTTWATLRGGSTATTMTDPLAAGSTIWGGGTATTTTPNTGYDYLNRGIISWDTSGIPDTATISGATVTLYYLSKDNTLATVNGSLIDASPTSYTDFVVGDYSKTTFTRQAIDIPYTSLPSTANTSVVFTLNSAGIASINKTGYTAFIVTHSYDTDNISFTWASNKVSSIGYRSNAYNSGNFGMKLDVTYATGSAPVSSFTADNETPCSSDTVQFNDTSTNTPTTWDWRWWSNETTSSALQNPTYQFPPGLYNVRLYVSNAAGGDWENKTGFINSTDCTPPPTPTPTPTLSPFVVSFISNVTCGNVPFDVQFNDTSTGTPLTWNWSFGEGNFSNETNPVFRYNDTGIYTINFSANNTADSGWSNMTDYIRAVPGWYICPVVTTTIPTTWSPPIMPSTEIDTQTTFDSFTSLWWLWVVLILAFIILVRK
jgi:PKD repeat protein